MFKEVNIQIFFTDRFEKYVIETGIQNKNSIKVIIVNKILYQMRSF